MVPPRSGATSASLVRLRPFGYTVTTGVDEGSGVVGVTCGHLNQIELTDVPEQVPTWNYEVGACPLGHAQLDPGETCAKDRKIRQNDLPAGR